MTLFSNQFLQNIEVGFCDRNTCCFNPIPALVGSTISVGKPVSLTTNTLNSLYKVVPSTADDIIWGFTFIHTHKNSFASNTITDILPLGSNAIIYLKSGSAITAGDLIAYDIVTDTIHTSGSAEQIIGQALIGAGATNDLIPIYLNYPYGKFIEATAEVDLEDISELYRNDNQLYTDLDLETPLTGVFKDEEVNTFADSTNTVTIGSTTYVRITDEDGHDVKAAIGDGIYKLLLHEGEGSEQYLCYIEDDGTVSTTNILVTDVEIETEL